MFFEKLYSIFGYEEPQKCLESERKNTLQPGLQEIYSECYKFTDFQLVSSSGDKIPCHRIILAARCRFFFDMFKNVSENCTNEPLKVESANTKDLQAFVDYIYTDKVKQTLCKIKNFFFIMGLVYSPALLKYQAGEVQIRIDFT